MSFRKRLLTFFLAIVVLPMAAVGVILFGLIGDNEAGKTSARLRSEQRVEVRLFASARGLAQTAAAQIAADRFFGTAIQDGDRVAARRRARVLLRARGVKRIFVRTREGRVLVDVGDGRATAMASTRLQRPGGGVAGTLEVSVLGAERYVAEAARLVEGEVAVIADDRVLATSLIGASVEDLASAEPSIAGNEYRSARFTAPGFAGDATSVVTLVDANREGSAVTRARRMAGAVLAVFFLLACLFALFVSRALQRQVNGVLGAAKRLGDGDLDARVPIVGNDEFAQLGREFNKMARQLQGRLAELQRARERVQGSMRRLGQAVGSNLDADALLQLVVETAVEGVDADAGRVIVRAADGELQEAARVGDGGGVSETVRQAEARALEQGRPVTVATQDAVALAHPLRLHGVDTDQAMVNGVVAVGRAGRPFSLAETELFHYLAAQAAVSVENVGRHEAVALESVTDPLTGLANRRRFDETLDVEVDRARRLGQTLGLVLLDLDDFKAVNDAHGHQQGDVVLVEVARVLRRACREIDLPARYGGEELAVIVPGADLAGAAELAERVRLALEELKVPAIIDGVPLRVTASFGVSSLPETADSGTGLLAVADAALYRAKAGGKNRVAQATEAEPAGSG